jgi:hypothetical protein
MRIISEDGKMDDELEALQQRREVEIEKLDKDLPLMGSTTGGIRDRGFEQGEG